MVKDNDILNINSLYKSFIVNRDIIIPNEINRIKKDFIGYYEYFSFIPFKTEIQNFINEKLENIEMSEYVGITEKFVDYIKKTEKFVNEYNEDRKELIDNILNALYIYCLYILIVI